MGRPGRCPCAVTECWALRGRPRGRGRGTQPVLLSWALTGEPGSSSVSGALSPCALGLRSLADPGLAGVWGADFRALVPPLLSLVGSCRRFPPAPGPVALACPAASIQQASQVRPRPAPSVPCVLETLGLGLSTSNPFCQPRPLGPSDCHRAPRAHAGRAAGGGRLVPRAGDRGAARQVLHRHVGLHVFLSDPRGEGDSGFGPPDDVQPLLWGPGGAV